MPRPEWSFFLPADDHIQIKWALAFIRSRLTHWGQIMLAVLLPGMVISSGKSELSAYLFPSFIIALLLTSFLLSLFFRPRVQVERILPPSPHAGGKYIYRVVVRNLSRRPLRNLAIFEDTLPYGLYADPGNPLLHNTVDWLDPGREAVLSLALKTPVRGVFELPYLIAGSSFPSGISRITVRAGRNESLTVYPAFLEPPEMPDHFRRVLQPGGIPFSSRTGDSNEFISTREYRDGDRVRDIHWPSSARAGKLIIKEYIEEAFVRVGLFLDTARERIENRDCFESRISLCAGLARQLDASNHYYDLYLGESRNPHWQASQGVDSFHRFLQRLALIEGERELDLNMSASLILQDAACLSSVILILKDWDAPRSRLVNQLRKAGLHLSVIIVTLKPTSLDVTDHFISVLTPRELKRAVDKTGGKNIAAPTARSA